MKKLEIDGVKYYAPDTFQDRPGEIIALKDWYGDKKLRTKQYIGKIGLPYIDKDTPGAKLVRFNIIHDIESTVSQLIDIFSHEGEVRCHGRIKSTYTTYAWYNILSQLKLMCYDYDLRLVRTQDESVKMYNIILH